MSHEFISQIETLIAQGQQDEALSIFMPQGAGLSPQELDVLRRSPAWAARLASAHTIPREVRALNEYGTDVNRLRTLSVPTLMLVGERTNARLREAALAVAGMIPGCHVRELAGQGHAAHQTAPELLATALTEFLLGVAK